MATSLSALDLGCGSRQDEKKALALPWRGCPVRGAPDAGGPARSGPVHPQLRLRSICHISILFLVCVFLSSTIYTIIALVL